MIKNFSRLANVIFLLTWLAACTPPIHNLPAGTAVPAGATPPGAHSSPAIASPGPAYPYPLPGEPPAAYPQPEQSPGTYPYPQPGENTLPSPYPEPGQAAAPNPTPNPSPQPGEMPGQPAPANDPLWQPQPGDKSLVAGMAFIEKQTIQTLESFPLQFIVNLEGYLPTPCNHVRATIAPPNAQGRIDLNVYSVSSPDEMCIQVIEPFKLSIPLKDLPAGQYQVYANGQFAGTFNVP